MSRQTEKLMTPREVGELLGLGKTAVARLIFLGRSCRGRHPLWGGLWPVFKLGHSRRVAVSAVQAHLALMQRLETDAATWIVAKELALSPRYAGIRERYRGFVTELKTLDGLKESKGRADGLEGEELRAKRGGADRRAVTEKAA